MATKPNNKFIGVFVSEEMGDSLRLMALLQGVGKSTLVRNIIQQKIEDNDWTEQNLIERYANTVYSQWVLRYKETQTFHSYLNTIRYEIRNLPSDLLEKIIKKCKEAHQSANK